MTEFPTVSGMESGLSPPSDLVQFNTSGMSTRKRLNYTVQFIIMYICTYVYTVYSKCTVEITIFCPLSMRMKFNGIGVVPGLQRTFDLWCSFYLILAITPPLEVLLNDGSLLGDEQTQLDLGGPLAFDALLRTYYGFVERDGTSFLSSLSIGSSGGTQVGVWY